MISQGLFYLDWLMDHQGEFTLQVLDDEAVVRNVMVTVLLRAGYGVLEADSAAEALELSNKFDGAIDLLIADHLFKNHDRPGVGGENISEAAGC